VQITTLRNRPASFGRPRSDGPDVRNVRLPAYETGALARQPPWRQLRAVCVLTQHVYSVRDGLPRLIAQRSEQSRIPAIPLDHRDPLGKSRRLGGRN
jgi:hypothetical protein